MTLDLVMDFKYDIKSTNKRKNRSRGFCQNWKLSSSKDITEIVKREAREWKKIFVNHVSDKGLGYRICKELLELKNKKTENLIKRWAKDLNWHFSREYKWPMGLWKKCSVITEMQIKTTVRYHFTSTRMAFFKKTRKIISARMQRNWNCHIAVGNVNGRSTADKFGSSSKS